MCSVGVASGAVSVGADTFNVTPHLRYISQSCCELLDGSNLFFLDLSLIEGLKKKSRIF